MNDLSREEWVGVVASTLARHPDWAGVTVEAMQAGLTEAIDRQKDRVSDLSLGLVEALSTRPGSKRRNSDRIVQAIRVSNFYNTKWSAETIAKEER